jgi:hypothetical protein
MGLKTNTLSLISSFIIGLEQVKSQIANSYRTFAMHELPVLNVSACMGPPNATLSLTVPAIERR